MADASPVEAVIEDGRWERIGIEDIAGRAASAVLRASGRDLSRHEISLLACDDARISMLNEGFRGKAAPTNVLSWPAFEPPVPLPAADGEPVFLGDIAIAFETCAREAAEADKTLGDHAAHLIVHGVLHLLGHDHEEEAAAEAMEAIETKVLATMGIANPYSPKVRPCGVATGQET